MHGSGYNCIVYCCDCSLQRIEFVENIFSGEGQMTLYTPVTKVLENSASSFIFRVKRFQLLANSALTCTSIQSK